MAHGYSIASQGIAELANQLLHQNIFTAIDMPVESHFETITNKLKQYLSEIRNCHEIIVMVDMGSLEGIQKYIDQTADLDIGIINKCHDQAGPGRRRDDHGRDSLETILNRPSSARCRIT